MAACFIATITLLAPSAEAGSPNPATTITAETTLQALTCTSPPARGRVTVLLLHGAGQTPESNWSWTYARYLPPAGFRACMLRSPLRGLGDIQLSAEYVAHAVRQLYADSGRRVQLLGYSLGGLQARWALRWWHGLRALIDDVIMLGTPNHGMAKGDSWCQPWCAPAVHQMRPGARFIALVNSSSETYPGPSWTSIYSRFDGIVEETSPPLAGASNISVEELCPLRGNNHGQYLTDAAVHAAVIDALTHSGPADFLRIDRRACVNGEMAGTGTPAPASGPTPPNVDREPAAATYTRN